MYVRMYHCTTLHYHLWSYDKQSHTAIQQELMLLSDSFRSC